MKTPLITLAFLLTGLLARSQDTLRTTLVDSVRAAAPRYVNDVTANTLSQAQLFSEVDPTGYDLLNANLSFSDKDQVQKIGFSPLRLLNTYYGIFSNLRLNISHKGGALTSGLSLGYDNTAYDSRRVQRLFDEFSSAVRQLPAMGPRQADESLNEYREREYKHYKTQLDSMAGQFDEKRLRHIVKISGGYNAQFFSVLRSKSDNSNFDSLNYHGFKGHNFFISGSYSLRNGWLNVNGGYNYFNKRKAADSLQQRNRYNGWSFGISKRVVRLISEEQLKKKDFYINSRFIPSLYVGFAYEQADYLGDNYLFAEDNAKHVRVYTPFIDVALSPAAQFRLAIPIRRTDEYVANTKGELVGAVLQFNYKLINLN
ncbi:hypothetical protein [Chitinophaga alhagiae]|uniref:hypothetical protein n=1 Tax=Chitinophaga alhagiae TaxID=2203219 RepID=UPI000E5A13BC|nr:hypothetical protein [Chitinophaga alhagiae]